MNINKISYVREVELVYKKLNTQAISVNNPGDVAEFMIGKTGHSPVERFYVLDINNKNKVVGCRLVSQGTVTESIVHPREVFIDAVISQASGIIVVHNHPSGNCTPSQQDIKTTERLVECGKIIGIPVIDHIIVTGMNDDGKSFYSMKENGYF